MPRHPRLSPLNHLTLITPMRRMETQQLQLKPKVRSDQACCRISLSWMEFLRSTLPIYTASFLRPTSKTNPTTTAHRSRSKFRLSPQSRWSIRRRSHRATSHAYRWLDAQYFLQYPNPRARHTSYCRRYCILRNTHRLSDANTPVRLAITSINLTGRTPSHISHTQQPNVASGTETTFATPDPQASTSADSAAQSFVDNLLREANLFSAASESATPQNAGELASQTSAASTSAAQAAPAPEGEPQPTAAPTGDDALAASLEQFMASLQAKVSSSLPAEGAEVEKETGESVKPKSPQKPAKPMKKPKKILASANIVRLVPWSVAAESKRQSPSTLLPSIPSPNLTPSPAPSPRRIQPRQR